MARESNLPASPPPLIGREAELATLRVALSQGRLVSLTGPGGCGKTRLAMQLALDVRATFPDGVWWIELSPLARPDALLDHVCSTVGLPEDESHTSQERLIAHWQDRTILLALDNCEHLVEAVARLSERLLYACPHLKILATSQESLNIPYETIRPVPPLATPDSQNAQSLVLWRLLAFGSVQLFVQRAAAIAPGFTLTEGNRAAVARICQLVDGIPLAIELAVGCLALLSPERIATELEAGSHGLVHGSRTAAPRQRTLAATMAWSYGLLAASEQALFRHLCVAADAFTMEFVQAVAGSGGAATREQFKRLVDTSMVQVDYRDVEPRYRILQTLAQFGRDQLRAADEEEDTFERYLTWRRTLVQAAAKTSEGALQAACFDRMEDELAHLRAVLRWLVARNRASEALELITLLQGFWRQRRRLVEGRRWLEEGLAASPCDVAPLVRARALNTLAVYVTWQGDYAHAEACCQQALAIFRKEGRESGAAMSLFRLGTAQQRARRFVLATRHLTMSLDLYTHLGEGEGVIMARYGLGLVALAQGDYLRAEAHLADSLRYWRAQGSLGGVASTALSLGVVALERDEYAEAEQLLRESLSCNRALKDSFACAYALVYLAQAALGQERLAQAHAWLGEALTLSAPTSNAELLARLFDGVALLALQRGDLVCAAELWGATETIKTSRQVAYWPAERLRAKRALATAHRRSAGQTAQPSLASAWARGETLTVEEMFARVQSHLDQSRPTTLAARSTSTASDLCAQSPRRCAATAIAPGLPPLRIYALGAVRVTCGEEEVTPRDFTYAKARELLLYLLHHSSANKRQIGLALWPDASEEQLQTTFRVVVYHLRRALGHASRVALEGGLYMFTRGPDDWYDVDTFNATIASAQRKIERDPDTAIALLEEARLLYQGDFCAERPMGDWMTVARDTLRNTHLSALVALGHLRLERGDPRRALSAFLEATGYDNYCEDAHRGALRCYLLLHEHSQAARYLERLRRQFERELGVAPSPETTALLQSTQLLQKDAR